MTLLYLYITLTNYFIMSIQDYIEIKQTKLYTTLLKEIIAATHCHGCNSKRQVGLLGYVGRYCNKYCWKSVFNEEGNNCIDDTCEYCINDTNYTLAHSKYHSMWRLIISNNGVYWPMCSENKLCINECIKYKNPVQISGYNS